VKDLLFLSHRLPYPPDKGDKIRSWEILRHLAARNRVHLGTFVDDADDARHVAALEKICATVCALKLSPRQARLRSLTGLFTGEALSARYFRDARLSRWIRATIDDVRPSRAFVFCSAMAPYAMDGAFERRIIDMVDLDSEKWRQYATAGSGIMSALYRREGDKLLQLERRAAAAFDATLFVSAAEARLFADRAPEIGPRAQVMENGVDLQRFDPARAYRSPFPRGRRALVFTGAMDYRPNVDAVCWFAAAVMPLLRRHWGNLDFWIVGSHPTAEVRRLGRQPNIRVTGRVADVRPYLSHADAVVAPLRIARGIQNKVLEGMAMAKPVIASPEALAAFGFAIGDEVLQAANPAEFAAAIKRALSSEGATIGARAHSRIAADYRWETKLAVLDALFDGTPSRVVSAPAATFEMMGVP